jgi:ABC-type Zn uptake system ZnuABC Zn-binding protein ZnuA
LNPEQIKNLYQASAAYKKLATEYKDCIEKIDFQLFYMVKDAKQYNSRDYIVQEGKVGYKELDGISFNSVYGYQTMFIYIY